jgi:hypothetical protein
MLNHKKVLSLALAGAMAASLAVPSFAADSTTESTTNRSTKVTGNYQAVDIAVVVPSTGTVVINPYALPVVIGKDDSDKDIKVENTQIVTKPLAIKNQSEIKLDVNVSATASVTGAFTFAAAPISADDIKTDTKNEGFVYVDIETSSLTGDADTVSAAAIATAWKDVKWTEYATTGTASNVLALKATTTAISKAGMGTLAAAKMDDDGAFSSYESGSIAFVGLCGQCAQSPKTAWVAKDGLTANLAFTFTPNTDA